MDRSITPPPQWLSYPLTPPPTGGFDKRVSFDDARVTSAEHRRFSLVDEGESLTEFFEESREGSDVELSESEEEAVSLSNSTTPTTPVSDISIQSEPSITKLSSLLFAPSKSSDAPAVTKPFPLLELPLSARNKVYEHLLVIPGLICLRQKYTSSNGFNSDQIHPENRVLLPGISHALAQLTVNGPQIAFSCFTSTNINVLLANKEVLAEAKAVLYTKNAFEIRQPSTELSPPSDFSIRLFPPGCQRLVTKLTMRVRSFYNLHWLLSGGYNDIKNFYRGLDTLTLILELNSVTKGFARQWAKQEHEKWHIYVRRLQIEVAKDAFAAGKPTARKAKKVKTIPTWINLRVLFNGESYHEKLSTSLSSTVTEQAKRNELRNALVEAWELFKKGGR